MACQRIAKLVELNKYFLVKKPRPLILKAHVSGGKQGEKKQGEKKQGEKKCGKKPERKPVKKVDPNTKVAIVLSGCGMMDGTEVHEASAVAVHVTRCRLNPVFYAPFCPQADVIDHKTGEPMKEERNALTEGARIARGKIKCLSELRSCDAGAVIFPGGFGVGKTLSTYAQDLENFNLNGDVIRILTEFYEAKKPMGFLCIAGVLAARMFPCVKITLGMKGDPRKWPHSDAIEHAQGMGATVEARPVNDFSFDKQYLIFSTPAFMYNGTYNEVFEGIGLMVDMMSKIMK